MYDMLKAKVGRVARKLNFREKDSLKITNIIWDILTLKGDGRQTVDTREGYPLKVGGITVQMSYVEGQWHQN